MKGFDARWKDFPDYILGITAEIWEGRETGPRMKAYYAPEVIVRVPGGVSVGESAATRATIATLNEFPDRTLLGEDVIWSGTPEDGMLSSHRILSQATHAGDGIFGRATGTKITWRAIADCFAKDNQISDEWLVRDNGAVVRQLGLSPEDWARARVAAGEGGAPFTPARDIEGPYTGRGNDHPTGARLADILTRIMGAEFSVIPAAYDRASQLDYPGGVRTHGHAAADRFWLALRAAFPSALFTVEHVIGRDDPMMPPRAAVRWSLYGTHDGWGGFGAPSGAEVHVMGITHAEFGPWGLRREWTLYDETAIWTQIALHQG
ncbi:ester cyclase [Ovoidimarina sediminis]|uniref:ester cyclase n=1 Tax=Ovoidimarina sediminis TaxID=3079856 RepID=UPI0029097F3D|nr:ester cyclase [Rhodophyticola sp. MJ-SS7]MDU8943428.1 ester cyclase [Rhodophyticola sp. MJ-SS7]